MRRCQKGLHDMTPQNTREEIIRRKSGDVYTSRRCIACANARMKSYMKEYRSWRPTTRSRTTRSSPTR